MTRDKNAIQRIADLVRPAWLDEAVWPYEARGLEIDGARIAYYDVGAGPTLLMVHTGLWSFIWRDLIHELSDHFRCIAIDSPGTGQSRPSGRTQTLDRAAAAVDAVARALELRELTLVIHDLGGIAGIAGVRRSAATLRGIVAVNTFAWQPTGTALKLMLRLVGSAAAREVDVFTGVVPRITATRFGIGRRLDRAARHTFRESMRAPQIRAFHQYLSDAGRCECLYRETDAALNDMCSRVPLLTIFGSHNDPFGFQAEWMRRFTQSSELVLKGGNHFPMCDDPGFVARAIREWTRETRRSRAS